MNLHQAKNILRKANSLYSHRYWWRAFALNPQNICLESKWLDYRASFSKRSFQKDPDLSKETTYTDCISTVVYLEDDKIIARITMFNGDMYTGARQEKLCEFKYEINVISEEFEKMLKNAFDDMVTNQVEEWENERIRKLFDAARAKLQVELSLDADFFQNNEN